MQYSIISGSDSKWPCFIYILSSDYKLTVVYIDLFGSYILIHVVFAQQMY